VGTVLPPGDNDTLPNQQNTNQIKANLTEPDRNDSNPPYQFIEPQWVLSGNGGPLQESRWMPPKNSAAPTRGDSGVQWGVWPTNAHDVEEEDTSNQSLQQAQGYSIDTSLQYGPSAETVSTSLANTEVGSEKFQCNKCRKSFHKAYLLNKHSKQHERPFKCTSEGCNKSFPWKRDYDRHLSAKHPQMAPGLTRWSCPFENCKFSSHLSTGSARKDNVDRHIRTQHGADRTMWS
jgi:hypothetical protein